METFEGELVVHERNRWLVAAMAVLGAVGILAIPCVALPARLVWLTLASSVLAGACLGLLPWVLQTNALARKRVRRVRVMSEGLCVDGRVRSRVHDARVLRRGDALRVRLLGRLGIPVLDVSVSTDEEAEAIVRASGHGVEARSATFRGDAIAGLAGWAKVGALTATVLLTFAPYLAFLALRRWFPLLMPNAPWPLLVGVLATLTAMFFLSRERVVIGTDGVLVRSAWRRRFVAFDALGKIEVESNAVGLHADGEVVRIVLGDTARGFSWRENAVTGAFAARVEDALAVFRARASARSLAAKLSRYGEATRDAWLERLRAVAGLDATYREPAVRDDELWSVVEDPGAPESARLGAAWVLRRREGDHEPVAERLRVAAETTAAPRLRVGLAAVADGGAPDLEDAPEERRRMNARDTITS